jgi:hypothetical protein
LKENNNSNNNNKDSKNIQEFLTAPLTPTILLQWAKDFGTRTHSAIESLIYENDENAVTELEDVDVAADGQPLMDKRRIQLE